MEVYPDSPQIRSDDHAQDIFVEINKAEPVKFVDMPGVAASKDRKLISQAVNKTRRHVSDHVQSESTMPSTQCQCRQFARYYVCRQLYQTTKYEEFQGYDGLVVATK